MTLVLCVCEHVSKMIKTNLKVLFATVISNRIELKNRGTEKSVCKQDFLRGN